MKLSICVITMNRASQLKEALESCIRCILPSETEFVILDNASTDNTAQIVKEFETAWTQYAVRYYYSSENLGVGGGRSKVFELAKGEFAYFLDDDAIVDIECAETFFTESISFMEEQKIVASLSTNIVDENLNFDRGFSNSSELFCGLKLKFAYLGGSHFLRKSCFDTPIYFNIKYGNEEYLPSIYAMDKGYIHVFKENIRIVHKPKVNKWIDGSDYMREVLVRGQAVSYATKKMLYPIIFYPIIYLGYMRRCSMYLKQYKGALRDADMLVKEIIRSNKAKKIRAKTVVAMYKKFGMTVF
jgi:glycosyltransferase involved in cell wall biosynthesis